MRNTYMTPSPRNAIIFSELPVILVNDQYDVFAYECNDGVVKTLVHEPKGGEI